jgi:rfaE bifunctional protein nucleotidyltransferase chain/domain
MTADFERKICDPRDAPAAVARLARPLVFTNGVFDLLHRGHVTYLAQARALGASLVVGVNGDASARRLGKGADRPINALPDRLAVLAALEAVSLVTWFDEDTPLRLILAVRPDVLV